MRAAVLTPDHRIATEEVDPPAPDPDQVVVAPVLVGLCGSDVSYATKGANGSFVQQDPMILGHEVCARLLTDTRVHGINAAAGSLVAVHPLWPSPVAGESVVRPEHADDRVSFLGSASTHPPTPGGLAEQLAVRPEQLRILPDGLPAERAVLAEPLAVVLHGFNRLQRDLTGRRVLVCGAGPIGLLCIVVAAARGAGHIAVTDLHRRPRELAVTLGADAAVEVPHDSPPTEAYDIAIEATGVWASTRLALDALAPEGHLLQLGMLPREPAPASLAAVVTKELTVVGTHRFAGELDEAIAFLATHEEAARVVTHHVGLEEVDRAIALAADAARASKVVVHIGGSDLRPRRY
ncbi:MAG: zinc-binding dehydrogenase [Propioniciclava sp.]